MRFLLPIVMALAALGAQDRCKIPMDTDGDGREETITVAGGGEEGEFVAIDSLTKRRWRIDRHVVTRECRVLTLFGRKGVLIVSRGMQLRFYEPGAKWGDAWTYQDLYSFYTDSWQGGLVQADVDRDGLPDLFCGNYWVKSPKSFEEPWRLYAINTFHEHPASASAQLHWDGRRLLWMESKRPKGRVVWFTPPADVKQLWTPQPHELNGKLDCPQLSLRDGQPVISASKRRCR